MLGFTGSPARGPLYPRLLDDWLGNRNLQEIDFSFEIGVQIALKGEPSLVLSDESNRQGLSRADIKTVYSLAVRFYAFSFAMNGEAGQHRRREPMPDIVFVPDDDHSRKSRMNRCGLGPHERAVPDCNLNALFLRSRRRRTFSSPRADQHRRQDTDEDQLDPTGKQ